MDPVAGCSTHAAGGGAAAECEQCTLVETRFTIASIVLRPQKNEPHAWHGVRSIGVSGAVWKAFNLIPDRSPSLDFSFAQVVNRL